MSHEAWSDDRAKERGCTQEMDLVRITVTSQLIALGWGQVEVSCALQALWRGGAQEIRETLGWMDNYDEAPVRATAIINDLQRVLFPA